LLTHFLTYFLTHFVKTVTELRET